MSAFAASRNVLISLKPRLYAKQRDAIFHKARYVAIEASTKAGKTVGCIQWIVWRACQIGDGRKHWWVAPVYSQTNIAYRRLKRALVRQKGKLFKFNDQELTVTFPNGAIIEFKSGEKSDNLYGEDVHSVVVDEASRVRVESWYAIRSTLTQTQGLVRLIGNVKGKKNWFYKLARKAEQGRKGWHYALITAYDAIKAGVLTQTEIEDARDTLPEDVFKELYLGIPTDDGANPFGSTYIRKCSRDALSNSPVTVWGIDVAKSVDWFVIVGLDSHGNMAAFHRWQRVPWETSVQRTLEIVCAHPGSDAIVDSTGVGDPVLEALQLGAHSNCTFTGYTYSASSKQQLMLRLAVSIQRAALGICTNVLTNHARPDHFSDIITDELESFEYMHTRTGVTYNAPEGEHDDCVNALALANYGLGTAPRPLDSRPEDYDLYAGRMAA